MKQIISVKLITLITVMLVSITGCKAKSSVDPLEGENNIRKILYYASLAGSSHNSQPWKAEVYAEDSILIFADTTRKLSVVDPTSRELYISIGAFIENLHQAARCFGYETEIKIHAGPADFSGPLASVMLTNSTASAEDSILNEIKLRTTLRTPFDTALIKPSNRETLVSIDTSCIHYLPATSAKGQYIRQKESEAYAQQARNKNAQDELAGWIRFSNKDVKEKQDGLTTDGMGITGIGGFMVRNFFKPEDSKKESFVNQGIDKTNLQTENCGGWIVITQPSENIESWINTGRLYQAMHLKCRKMNIGFHPMNQVIEEEGFENEANQYLGLNGQIMFIARIGYVKDYPEPVSVRRPVESFTTFK
jgi:nitroreductase